MKPGAWHREASCRADADAPPPGRAASAPQLRAARVSKASLLVCTRTASGRRIAGAVVRGRCSDAAVPGHKGCASCSTVSPVGSSCDSQFQTPRRREFVVSPEDILVNLSSELTWLHFPDAFRPRKACYHMSIKTLRTDFSSLSYAKARVISILQTEITVKI